MVRFRHKVHTVHLCGWILQLPGMLWCRWFWYRCSGADVSVTQFWNQWECEGTQVVAVVVAQDRQWQERDIILCAKHYRTPWHLCLQSGERYWSNISALSLIIIMCMYGRRPILPAHQCYTWHLGVGTHGYDFRSPYVGIQGNPSTQCYIGDMHLHILPSPERAPWYSL